MRHVADFIDEHRDGLTQRFAEESPPGGLSREERLRGLPEYLDAFAAALRDGPDAQARQEARRRQEQARARQRLSAGLNQQEAIAEYVLLGRLVFALWEHLPPAERPGAEQTQRAYDDLQSAMEQVVAVYTGEPAATGPYELHALRELEGLFLAKLDAAPPHPSRLVPLLDTVQAVMEADSAALVVLSADGRSLVRAAATGRLRTLVPACLPLEAKTFASQVAEVDHPLSLADAQAPGARVLEDIRHSGLRSMLAMRLLAHGRLLGVLHVGYPEVRPLTPRVRAFFGMLGGHLASLLLSDGLLQQAHDALAQLRASEERFHGLLDSTTEGIWGVDREGRCTFANPACARLLGYDSPEQLLGHNMHALAHHSRPDGTPFPESECSVYRAIEHGETLADGEEILWRRDGTPLPVRYRAAPILRDGKLLGSVVTFEDDTVRRRNREELARRAQQAALAADIGASLTQSESMQAGLQGCAEALVRHLDAALVRIWMMNADEEVLELQASAGVLTRLDGPYQRLQVGQYLVGRVARDRAPVYFDDLLTVDRLHDPEWGRSVGLASVAGYPLLAGERVAGVLAVFGRRPLAPPLLDALQAIVHTLALGIERKRDHDAVRASEDRLRHALEAAGIGTWDFDPRSRKLFADSTARTLFGFDPGTAPTVDVWWDHLEEDDRARVRELVKQALDPAVRARFQAEFPVVSREGALRWILSRGRVHWSASGQAVRFVGTMVDVTPRKRTEETLGFLSRASTAMGASLDYRRTLEAVAQVAVPGFADWCGIVMRDGEGAVKLVAATHRDPKKVPLLHALHERFPLPLSAPHGYAKTLRTGESEIFPLITAQMMEQGARSPEHLLLTRALGTFSNLTVPLTAEGKPLGAILFGISDSRRLYGEADLLVAQEVARRASVAIDNARLFSLAQQERERAEEANRVKDEFLATISHELRTPLTAMLGWVQMLRAGRLGPERQQRAYETIERNARAQAQLVEDLLDVSRISSGKLRLERAPVHLEEVVRAATDSVMPAADAKGLSLETSIDGDLDPVMGDPNRLQQIIWNLLSNAVKFTPSGGRVRVSLRRNDGHAVITVTDTGAGIPPDFLPHVFERFRQADVGSTRRFGGLGLGLAIVKHLVEMHGGTIEALSAGEGKGATFRVQLPLSAEDGRAERASGGAGDVEELACPPQLSGLRVLLVEDEVDVRELVAALLQRCGARVVEAASTAEALEALRRERPDVLISDIGMPGEDGYALIRKVRALPPEEGGRVLAVAMTAYARREDRTRALLAGFQMHVPKPIEPGELLATLASLADRARA